MKSVDNRWIDRLPHFYQNALRSSVILSREDQYKLQSEFVSHRLMLWKASLLVHSKEYQQKVLTGLTCSETSQSHLDKLRASEITDVVLTQFVSKLTSIDTQGLLTNSMINIMRSITDHPNTSLFSELSKRYLRFRDRFVHSCLRLSVVMINRLKVSDDLKCDLLQEAHMAMTSAVNSFDPDRGCFSARASFIAKNKIRRYNIGEYSPVHVPEHAFLNACKIRTIVTKHNIDINQKDSKPVLMSMTKLSELDVSSAISAINCRTRASSDTLDDLHHDVDDHQTESKANSLLFDMIETELTPREDCH